MPSTIRGNRAVLFVRALLLTSLITGGLNAATLADDMKRIDSPTGFSILYPSSWVGGPPFEPDGRIDLEDAENAGQTGVVIAFGHAHIRVNEETKPGRTTLAQIIAAYKDDVVATQEQKSISVRDKVSDCSSLTKLAIVYTLGPREWVLSHHIGLQKDIAFFCASAGHSVITVNVLYWEHDKREALYQNIALRMAQSIQFPR